MASDSAVLTPQALNFIEKVSLHYETAYALPRIGCRILALLLLAPRPQSSLEMERTLKVSHGSVSSNLRLLGAMGYLEKVTYPGDRTTYYRFLPRSRVKVLQARIHHYQALQQLISVAQQELQLQGNAPQNLEEMAAWADLAIKMNSRFIAEWEEHFQDAKTLQSGE